ncbi:MAG: Sapep family Mn(2+)-dependent dipeptidase [Firmicutes bacterium]|nr:Sapep family Mn(2+)-dependent dipeptidase [Bacillota bacterium]
MPDPLLSDLAELLALQSLQDKAEKNAPFGMPMRETLDWFLSKAKGYGLKTGDLDGYCGWAEYGEGEEMFGILCHLDTVPADEADGNWSVPPFALSEKDGYYYGRGVVDDKGPAVVCLHVLKRLRDEGVKLNRRVRLIVGCNEETGSACIKHYLQHGEIPAFAFTPDADFPVINSEKAILHLKITLPDTFRRGPVFIRFGNRPNVIPSVAKARVLKDSELGRLLTDKSRLQQHLASDGFDAKAATVRDSCGYVEIEARGTAGHAMAPHKADNAAWKLFATLSVLKNPEPSDFELIYELFCSKDSAKRLGIAVGDPKSGALTMSFDMCECNSLDTVGAGAGQNAADLVLALDLRLPLCADKNAVIGSIERTLRARGRTPKLETLYYSPNLYIDPESKLIKTLLGVYAVVSGQGSGVSEADEITNYKLQITNRDDGKDEPVGRGLAPAVVRGTLPGNNAANPSEICKSSIVSCKLDSSPNPEPQTPNPSDTCHLSLVTCHSFPPSPIKPIQTGGGTYARSLPHAAAFGPTFPGAETHIHDADERIGVAEFNKLSEIYYAAVRELDGIVQ